MGSRTPELDAAWDAIALRTFSYFSLRRESLLIDLEALDLYVTEEEARGIPDIPQGMWQDPKTGNYMIV